jgi:toxin ParE1/3/4
VSVGYVIRPKADRDIDDILEYLAEEASLDMALQFLSEIRETFGLLATHKEMGWLCKVRRHPQLSGARTFRVSGRFENYLIFYQPYQARVEILRVVHGSQDLQELFDQQGMD